jgi:predicted nucleic acid-binding Zn ribbon protein
MGRAADWLREERRKVLGDWAAFCLRCGAVRRWFDEFEGEVDATCGQCGGVMLRRCPACDAPFASAFAIECERCGAPLRERELFGTPIRRRG